MKSLLIVSALAALAAPLAVSTNAQAGECPAGKMMAGAVATGPKAPNAVTDTELNAVKLGTEINGLDNRRLRLRRLVVQPGGIVPWHSHTDRPALIMTVSGQIVEHRSTCSVGIVHKAGDVTQEVKGVMHWWQNNGKVPAVLIAADIKNDVDPAATDHM
jgi:quercetin dioxygenase-like cupin family protein